MCTFTFPFDKNITRLVTWTVVAEAAPKRLRCTVILIGCFSALFVLPSASQQCLFADGDKQGAVVSGMSNDFENKEANKSADKESPALVAPNKNDKEPIAAQRHANSLSGRIVFKDDKALKQLKLGDLNISPFRSTKDNKRMFRVPERQRWIDLGIPDESLMVGEDGGIANVIVWALDVPEIQDWSGPIPSPAIVAKEGRFQPHVLPIWNWGKLKLENEMPEIVDFHLEGVKNSFNVQLPQYGEPTREDSTSTVNEFKLNPERFPVAIKSNRNYWMKSYVLPLEHPCFAVTDKDGRFKINHLPPGETVFAMWHEKVGLLKTEKHPTGRFKFNIVHAENSIDDLELAIAPFKKKLGNEPASENRDDPKPLQKSGKTTSEVRQNPWKAVAKRMVCGCPSITEKIGDHRRVREKPAGPSDRPNRFATVN